MVKLTGTTDRVEMEVGECEGWKIGKMIPMFWLSGCV